MLNGGVYNGVRIPTAESVKKMTSNQIGDRTFGELDDGTTYRFAYGFAVFPDAHGLRGERSWGGIWGTTFRISLGGDWVAILLTRRVSDDSSRTREVTFTRVVRRAIQEKKGVPVR